MDTAKNILAINSVKMGIDIMKILTDFFDHLGAAQLASSTILPY